jgi:hypothetical protein
MPKQSMTVERRAILNDYSAGRVGTRRTIERLGLRDYAELVIALAQNDLDLPKPSATPAHEAHLARARAILQPRLRHGR